MSRCLTITKLWIFAISLLVTLAGIRPSLAAAQAVAWRTTPTYQTAAPKNQDSSLVITDAEGKRNTVYKASYGIIFEEGHYAHAPWADVSAQADTSASEIKDALEVRGYNVLIWKDLTGAQMRGIIDQVETTIGSTTGSRLFFYYFGHGDVLSSSTAPQTTPEGRQAYEDGKVGYLVPSDGRNPAEGQAFVDSAIPIHRFVELAHSIKLKHAFFAFEACEAGSIFDKLLGSDAPPANGYILGYDEQRNVRHIITAGDSREDVPAGRFTKILLAGMQEAEAADGYVTGSSLIEYLKVKVPDAAIDYKIHPQADSIPQPSQAGDMVIGLTSAKALAISNGASSLLGSHGNTDGIITAQVDGVVAAMFVRAGSVLQPGDVIFIQDPRTVLKETEKANLDYNTAKQNEGHEIEKLSRMRKMLGDQPNIAQRALIDDEEINFKILHSELVRALKVFNSAKLSLDYTISRAPVCGTVKRSLIKRGDTLLAGTPALVFSPGC